jgi:hypothetical protein
MFPGSFRTSFSKKDAARDINFLTSKRLLICGEMSDMPDEIQYEGYRRYKGNTPSNNALNWIESLMPGTSFSI